MTLMPETTPDTTPDATPAAGTTPSCAHPLLQRLVRDLNWPLLATLADVNHFTATEGAHCLLVPGNPVRNLETADAAVILPELRMTFQGAFDCALVDDAIEAEVREMFNALKTPGFLFFRDGHYLGSIQKIRDWDDYLMRIPRLLNLAVQERIQ